MNPSHHRTQAFAVLIVVLALFAPVAHAQQDTLGKVEFAVTGSPEARQHFQRGVLALHSFWFEEALEAFRETTKADPNCLMGYWGEAMALNHPLWGEQDTEGGRTALAKIKDTSRLTPRERAFIAAARVLYGEGQKDAATASLAKLDRDKAYAAAMEKLHNEFPDDLEVASFYSLSLLGTVRPGDKGFSRQARAGAVALEVFQKNPNHPGAAHYVIHSFDDPEHAILALTAAHRYASIAPEAHHARHMPSHIFLQLGMWPEAAASNESAWEASDNWVKHKNLAGSLRDFHSLHWLLYVYLQQGRYAKAEEVFALRRKLLGDPAPGGSGQMGTVMPNRYFADMAAEMIVETDRWDRIDEFFPQDAAAESPAAAGGAHAAHGGYSGAAGTPSRMKILAAFLRGLAAAQKGSGPAAAESAAQLRHMREQLTSAKEAYRARMVEIMELEVTALAAATKAKYDEAIPQMKRAIALEEEMSPPSGPPDMIKPSHELFGEILLRAGQPQGAADAFAVALQRQPNRARSLLGAARAAAKSGNERAAAEFYAKLLGIWRQADTQLAELREAQQFVRQHAARAAGSQ